MTGELLTRCHWELSTPTLSKHAGLDRVGWTGENNMHSVGWTVSDGPGKALAVCPVLGEAKELVPQSQGETGRDKTDTPLHHSDVKQVRRARPETHWDHRGRREGWGREEEGVWLPPYIDIETDWRILLTAQTDQTIAELFSETNQF